MPKLKRASENQLNKDIYDAGEDDRFGEEPDPGRGMTRASQDVLGRRKIVKVSRRKFGGGGSAPAPAPPTAQASRPPASSNPFASASLARPKATSASPTSKEVGGGGDPPAKPNPFANIAFASSATSATTTSSAPKPSFSFAPSAAPAPKPAMSTFSFSSNVATGSSSSAASQPKATATTAPKTTSLLSTPRSSVGKSNNKIRLLNENFMHNIVKHYEGGMVLQEFTPFLREYQEKGERLQLEDGERTNGIEASSAAGNSTVTTALSTSKENSQPASSWSFGGAAPAPAPAAKPFSMAASAPAAPPAGTFSFTSKPAAGPANGASSAAPAFSFGGLSSSSSVASAPSATGSNGNNDDPTSNPDDGKVDKVEQEENADEEVLHEVRAKHIKFENKAWKKYGTGVLRLYRHRVTSKHRMVIRNEIGKVQFNVGVSKGMKFEKVIKDTKKGKVAYVKFFAVEDASKGMENFMLQVKPEAVDKLHKTLEGMVA